MEATQMNIQELQAALRKAVKQAKLVFYYGSMNSSKSAQLIMTAYNFRQQNKSYLVFKSGVDTRATGIQSRALQTTLDADQVIRSEDDNTMYITCLEKQPDFVFVDEVQFFTPTQIKELARIVDELGINVICYGLLTDFKGELFPATKELVEDADSIREVKNQCYYCNNKANRNMRLLDGKPVFEGETVVVGAEELYVSVCRSCFNKARHNSDNL